MSVECRVLVGLTLELERDIQSFEKLHELEEKYPELDEYTHHREDREGGYCRICSIVRIQ